MEHISKKEEKKRIEAEKRMQAIKEKYLKDSGVEVENERIKTCLNCRAITKTSLKNWHCANCGVDN